MDHAATHAGAHPHPSAGTYIKIAIILFVLTALEVGGYEVARTGEPAGLAQFVAPTIVPILIVLSAAKFALVAMFYMHLKQDGPILSGIFVFPIILAIGIALALISLFAVVHLLVKPGAH